MKPGRRKSSRPKGGKRGRSASARSARGGGDAGGGSGSDVVSGSGTSQFGGEILVPFDESDPGSATSPTRPHVPVLLKQVLECFAGSAVGRMVDGTLGAGGHAAAMLDAHPEMILIGMDRDERALSLANGHLERFGSRFRGVLGEFSTIVKAVRSSGWESIDGVLLDIGVSSMQLDQSSYGMSFQSEAPLDMRMATTGQSAAELLAVVSEADLADLIYQYGEERLSRRIASRIKSALDRGEMNTTLDLARECILAYPRVRHRIHPATRTFQAIRIAVNDELGELERFLDGVPEILAVGAKVVVISFHSLEDRIVKTRFREWAEQGRGRILTKKPMTADEAEARDNPRSRSAKLRCFEWGVLRETRKRWRSDSE